MNLINKNELKTWVMEAIGTSQIPHSIKYKKPYVYVQWNKNDTSIEYYNKNNIYGECEDEITIDEYKQIKSSRKD